MTPDRTTPDKAPEASRQAVRAPCGAKITCQGWPQEAALRLLMNSLDPDVAEHSQETAISGSTQNVASDWQSFDAILARLRSLHNDDTLFTQSGFVQSGFVQSASHSEVPTGVFRSSSSAPRLVLIKEAAVASAGESTRCMESPPGELQTFINDSATSWLCVGAQGALQGAYEMLAAAAGKHFGGTLAGKLVLASNLDVVNAAYSLAATLLGGAFLGIDADAEQIKRRVKSGYCDLMVNNLDEALRILKNAVRRGEATSVGLVGNSAEAIPELVRRGVLPDLIVPVAHGGGNQTVDSIAGQMGGVSELQRLGAVLLRDDGNDDKHFGLRAIFGENREPLTWIALSGEPADIARADRLLLDLFAFDERLQHWIPLVQKHVRSQGLPARVVWLSRAERVQFAAAVNDLVLKGEVHAPFVFGRVLRRLLKSEYREGSTEASGPVPISKASTTLAGLHSEPALVNALLSAAAGASWAALEFSGDARAMRQVSRAIVVDGTADLAARIESVLGDAFGRAGAPTK